MAGEGASQLPALCAGPLPSLGLHLAWMLCEDVLREGGKEAPGTLALVSACLRGVVSPAPPSRGPRRGALPEGLDEPLYLLGLSLHADVSLELPQGLVQLHAGEVHLIHYAAGDRCEERLPGGICSPPFPLASHRIPLGEGLGEALYPCHWPGGDRYRESRTRGCLCYITTLTASGHCKATESAAAIQ